MTARKPRKPKTAWDIWLGRFRYGDRTIYAKTAASTRAECRNLIEEGQFFNTDPVRFRLTLPRRKGGRA